MVIRSVPRRAARHFLERRTFDDKNWTITMADANAREYWHDDLSADDDRVLPTVSANAPGGIVPADRTSGAGLIVGAALITPLDSAKRKSPTRNVPAAAG